MQAQHISMHMRLDRCMCTSPASHVSAVYQAEQPPEQQQQAQQPQHQQPQQLPSAAGAQPATPTQAQPQQVQPTSASDLRSLSMPPTAEVLPQQQQACQQQASLQAAQQAQQQGGAPEAVTQQHLQEQMQHYQAQLQMLQQQAAAYTTAGAAPGPGAPQGDVQLLNGLMPPDQLQPNGPEGACTLTFANMLLLLMTSRSYQCDVWIHAAWKTSSLWVVTCHAYLQSASSGNGTSVKHHVSHVHHPQCVHHFGSKAVWHAGPEVTTRDKCGVFRSVTSLTVAQ